MEKVLPLFPLSAVLLPGAHAPIHVFEERYRRLLMGCLEGKATFGIVLIAEGEEVEGPALPFSIGTEALIVEVGRLPGDRFNVLVRGGRRFRIEGLSMEGDLLLSRPRWLAEVEGEGAPRLRPTVDHLLSEYLRRLNLVPGEHKRNTWAHQDATAFSYTVADLLGVDPFVKQMLLESPTAAERLAREREILLEALGTLAAGSNN